MAKTIWWRNANYPNAIGASQTDPRYSADKSMQIGFWYRCICYNFHAYQDGIMTYTHFSHPAVDFSHRGPTRNPMLSWHQKVHVTSLQFINLMYSIFHKITTCVCSALSRYGYIDSSHYIIHVIYLLLFVRIAALHYRGNQSSCLEYHHGDLTRKLCMYYSPSVKKIFGSLVDFTRKRPIKLNFGVLCCVARPSSWTNSRYADYLKRLVAHVGWR